MSIKAVYANLACSDLESSTAWFERLFERGPDDRPMAGLCEWHFSETAGFQLHHNPDKAGKGTLTLGVTDVASDHKRLSEAGFDIKELYGKRGAAKGSGVAKYRNPKDASQTWTGRGRKPNWLVDAVKKGAKIDSFAI